MSFEVKSCHQSDTQFENCITLHSITGTQLVQHDNVIHRLMDIMKMDHYFRRTEDLTMIDPLVAYDESALWLISWKDRSTDQVCTLFYSHLYPLHLPLFNTVCTIPFPVIVL